ncbi:hypothetical protein EOB36_20480 [Mesorhizobium sp. M6A.T.Cr.TU.017.01.1.1]|uniref:hypothetical protein n=1 Tax=Mesorhizobium sp. M6A.T.Cr.TU.017.01.1.1 TaxID=2496774 RepID=UPI000FD26F8C|nr:hypothetical protein [Mesorhizobium sp. M6A.T.Cr.TU.017.01.1.1]RUU99456.1 hypothetical protein EOB36_20480 [Mesorhizobium sp. M6A.T.Cr.TU.017.01.1.1]
MITFRKSDKSDGQFVYDADELIGIVRKDEAWTVRGTRVSWLAYRKGTYIGSAETRGDAAKLLAILRAGK